MISAKSLKYKVYKTLQQEFRNTLVSVRSVQLNNAV